MMPETKRRVQIYTAVLALALLALAITLGKSGYTTFNVSGFGAAWFSLLAALVIAVIAVLMLIYAARVAPLRLPRPGVRPSSRASKESEPSQTGPR